MGKRAAPEGGSQARAKTKAKATKGSKEAVVPDDSSPAGPVELFNAWLRLGLVFGTDSRT